MATLTIRNLDAAVKERLRVRARNVSMTLKHLLS
jgi:plasmid stability protein